MNSRKVSGRIAGATLLVLVAVGVSPAAAQDRFDVRIANAVAHQIDGYAQYSIFDYISGSVENGVVTLTGKVTMPYKKSDIEKKVAAVSGIREIQNRIDVLPVSTYDEDLRLKIARAIYGNSAFWQYAARANPPIHILVERGHVTLVGVVNSQVDRALARSLATGLGELSVTNDLRTDVEARSH